MRQHTLRPYDPDFYVSMVLEVPAGAALVPLAFEPHEEAFFAAGDALADLPDPEPEPVTPRNPWRDQAETVRVPLWRVLRLGALREP